MVPGVFPFKIVSDSPAQISIFSNGGHLGYRTGLPDTNLKGTHPGTIPVMFGLIWFRGFRGEDLNVISNFNCSYMASSLAYVRGFCLKFFFQPIYTDCAN
jgi:hypothetical protein